MFVKCALLLLIETFEWPSSLNSVLIITESLPLLHMNMLLLNTTNTNTTNTTCISLSEWAEHAGQGVFRGCVCGRPDCLGMDLVGTHCVLGNGRTLDIYSLF
jgi:hypothetical protein